MRRIRELPSASDGIAFHRTRRVNSPRLQPRPHRPLGKLPATIGVADKFPVVTRHPCGCACTRGHFTPPFRRRPSSKRRLRILRGCSRGHTKPPPDFTKSQRPPSPSASSVKSVVNPDLELRRGHAPRSGRPGRPTLPRGYRWRCVNPPRRRPQPHRKLGTSPSTMDSFERLLVPTRHSCGCACRRGHFTPPFRRRPSSKRRFRILRGCGRGHIGPHSEPCAASLISHVQNPTVMAPNGLIA